MIASPPRAELGDYRAILFHTDDVTEISPRLDYAAAKSWCSDRGAAITFDEHAGPDDG